MRSREEKGTNSNLFEVQEMEIVFFSYEFPPYVVGGLGTYAEYVTREFIKMGHDVTVFQCIQTILQQETSTKA